MQPVQRGDDPTCGDGEVIRLQLHRVPQSVVKVFAQDLIYPLTAERVELHGQLVYAQEPLPLVAAVAWYRKEPIPVRPYGGNPRGLPPYVAVGVSVDQILARRAPAVHGSKELVPVLGAHVLDAPQIGSHPRL